MVMIEGSMTDKNMFINGNRMVYVNARSTQSAVAERRKMGLNYSSIFFKHQPNINEKNIKPKMDIYLSNTIYKFKQTLIPAPTISRYKETPTYVKLLPNTGKLKCS